MDWNSVKEEEGEGGGSFIKFNNIGESTVGVFTGSREVTGQYGPQTVLDFNGIEGKEPFSVTANPDLKRKTKKLVAGNLVRIEYIEDMDVGKESPMRVFKVQQAPTMNGQKVAPRPDSDIPF